MIQENTQTFRHLYSHSFLKLVSTWSLWVKMMMMMMVYVEERILRPALCTSSWTSATEIRTSSHLLKSKTSTLRIFFLHRFGLIDVCLWFLAAALRIQYFIRVFISYIRSKWRLGARGGCGGCSPVICA